MISRATKNTPQPHPKDQRVNFWSASPNDFLPSLRGPKVLQRCDMWYVYMHKWSLLGGLNPLKNMSSSVGMIIPNIWQKCSKPPTSDHIYICVLFHGLFGLAPRYRGISVRSLFQSANINFGVPTLPWAKQRLFVDLWVWFIFSLARGKGFFMGAFKHFARQKQP